MEIEGKKISEAMPELEEIAKELNLPLKDFRVMTEYFKRHPQEKKLTNKKENEN